MNIGTRIQNSFLISTPSLFEVICIAHINDSSNAHWQKAVGNSVFLLILMETHLASTVYHIP